jgi:hypothetical protein
MLCVRGARTSGSIWTIDTQLIRIVRRDSWKLLQYPQRSRAASRQPRIHGVGPFQWPVLSLRVCVVGTVSLLLMVTGGGEPRSSQLVAVIFGYGTLVTLAALWGALDFRAPTRGLYWRRWRTLT